MSTSSSIQGQLLDVTVVACKQLKDTEIFSRQDPYVCLEYASSRVRTRTCTDGGRNPNFQEKFQIPLIEGLRELNITVWNSNTFSQDTFIGTGIVQLYKVLSEGYDDSSWSLQTRSLKYAGEVKLVLYFTGASSTKKKENRSTCSDKFSPCVQQLYVQQPPPPHSTYSVVGFRYNGPPYAPPTNPGECYPPPTNPSVQYPPPYGLYYQPPPGAQHQHPYHPPTGPYQGVYPPSN